MNHNHNHNQNNMAYPTNMNMSNTTHPPTTTNHMNMGHHGTAFFHFSKTVTILFEGWKVDTVEGIVASCFAVFVIAALYEGLKVGREILKRRYSYVVSVDLTETKTYGTGPGQTAVITESKGQLPRSRLCNWHHFLQTFLHIVQVTVSYFLMLIFMTYNVWLCLAVALGAGCGYFIFGWKLNKVVDIYEHCH